MKRSGAGVENFVMIAQSGPTRPWLIASRRADLSADRRCQRQAGRQGEARARSQSSAVDGPGVGQVVDWMPDPDDRVGGGQRVVG